jgi:hypothetical protein
VKPEVALEAAHPRHRRHLLEEAAGVEEVVVVARLHPDLEVVAPRRHLDPRPVVLQVELGEVEVERLEQLVAQPQLGDSRSRQGA